MKLQLRTLLLGSVLSLACGLSAFAADVTAGAVTAVPAVDLSLYSGTWYEIASFPAPFQPADCTGTTATYTVNLDGSVKVWNQCYQPTDSGVDRLLRVEGRAVSVNAGNSQLKVSFFGPFAGDYWVLDLDDNYQTALVGTPNRRFLWILHREPVLAESTYQRLLKKAKAQGFNIQNLRRTPPREARFE